MLAIRLSEFGSRGAFEMSRFQGLSLGKGTAPFRLAPMPRSGVPANAALGAEKKPVPSPKVPAARAAEARAQNSLRVISDQFLLIVVSLRQGGDLYLPVAPEATARVKPTNEQWLRKRFE